MGACAVALWCALVLATGARSNAYTVDCNHDYTDCDTELRKITADDDDLPSSKTALPSIEPAKPTATTTNSSPILSTEKTIEFSNENRTEVEVTTEARDAKDVKPKPRLLNLNVDELQSFANALHNQTNENDSRKNLPDLSDVTLDDDEDEPRIPSEHKHKEIPDKFYSNLQAPFHPLMMGDRSEEMETCKENDIAYKIGERIDRGCEETCECVPGGIFECSPRCKHPYIRRGRRLNDPLCFESPVDDCCSIIACANGNGEVKTVKLEVCRYGNDTYQTGSKWSIGCEQTCSCEPNSIVTCKPRCSPLLPSDKCINVQDPKDACCEVQVCDVSQDVHEEPADNVTISTTPSSTVSSTSTVTSQSAKGFEDYDELSLSTMRPLVLSEPIGSVKVLQNNTVQVNLMHVNNSEDPIHLLLSDDGGKTFKDVELKYSNLILNLKGGKDYILKTKETGTKFNFTITASGDSAVNEVQTEEFMNSTNGCYHDGTLYAVGEEFHIGCTELCECTGPDTHECAALVCPSHVGLELMSKGCVRWAPSPPAQPPNCCPRSARCLSDGTCHYKGIAVPNWSEVPISLTGCEQRCFCENGELDCQEVCTALPSIPPQTLRCPPMHRPAAVNISDEDCCKEWGCVPNAGTTNGSTFQTHSMPVLVEPMMNYVTPLPPFLPTTNTPVLSTPKLATDSIDFHRRLNPIISFPKFLKPVPIDNEISINSVGLNNHSDNMTVSTLDIDSQLKTSPVQPSQVIDKQNWKLVHQQLKSPITMDSFIKSYTNGKQASHTHPEKHPNYVFSDSKMHDLIEHSKLKHTHSDHQSTLNVPLTLISTVKKVPLSMVDDLSYFLPTHNKKTLPEISYSKFYPETKVTIPTEPIKTSLFEPVLKNKSTDYLVPRVASNSILHNEPRDHSVYGSRGKQVTILKNKDLPTKMTNSNHDTVWSQGTKTHVLSKAPNPYETLLLRAVPNAMADVSSTYNHNLKNPRIAGKTYSALNLEHLLSQMEVESEVNRNLGRSADKNQQVDAAGQTTPELPPHQPHPKQPPFLPTISPEIHFPQDEIPDYDQNNIHRPVNPLEPALQGLPPGLTVPPGYGELNKKLTVISIQADSPNSIKMLFGLPPVLVGLRGSVDLRYTDTADEDISHWYSQVFAPADEVLTTPRLEFRLTGLKPSTTYKIRGKLYLHNLPVEPESEIYSVRTQDIAAVVPIEEKRREIDSRLTVVDVNDTTAHISWRHFSEEELQFIDGIQVRYRPVGTPIYIMTELLHHSRSAAELHDLRPGSRYEASLVLVPPPRASTELHDPGRVEFTTAPYIDPYNWSVTVEARAVGSEAAELTWRGVPSPAERWVRVYRAAHACGDAASAGTATGAGAGGRREHDTFRLAARDLSPAVTLTGLEPNTRCRVWLELFLTNGKVKTSNVLEINTKSLDSDSPVDNEIEASSVAGSRGAARGDYYGALVVVGVVAALGALTSLLLLLVVVRRHRPHSVPITSVPSAPRESSLPPYDNPAYKLELQQETMDL